MDKTRSGYWSGYWSVLVLVLLTCGLSTAQDEEEDAAKVPPLIVAEIPDQVWFRVDDSAYQFTLDCEAEGSGPITYKWEKIEYDDSGVRSVVKDYSVDADDATVSVSKLHVDLPLATHQGAYQCTASNEFGSAVSRIVEVKRILFKKPKKGSEVMQNEASEGDHFRIECDDTNSLPPASFSWVVKSADKKKTEAYVPSDRVVVAGNGALMFAYVLPEDATNGKFLQCSQRNPKDDVKAGGQLNTFAVLPGSGSAQSPTLVYSTDLEGDTVVLGEHVRVQCVFSGNPAPRVSWSYRPKDGSDDEAVPEVLTHPGNQDNPDLTTLSHTLGKRLAENAMAPPPEGTLKCTGSNSEGDAEHTIPIKIEYPPRLAAHPSVRKVAAGEEVIFSCGADGNPKPDVQFLINGEAVESSDRRSVEEMTMDWKPYRAENSVLLVMRIPETCLDTDENTCEGGQDIFSIQCFARNKHGSAVGSGFLSLYDSEDEGAKEALDEAVNDALEELNEDEAAAEAEDENMCTDPAVLTSVDKCKDTYQDETVNKGLCLAYCHYHVCIEALSLDCRPPSIGDRDFCDGLCIEEGLMKDPSPPKKESKKYKGLSKKVITTICVLVLILIVLLLLFALYKVYKKRQQRRKYKGVSAVYKPTTEA